MSQQQTVLRVQTTQSSEITVTGTTSLNVVTGTTTTGVTYGGSGTFSSPYTGTTALNSGQQSIDFLVTGNGIFYYDVTVPFPAIGSSYFNAYIKHAGDSSFKLIFNTYATNINSVFEVQNGDTIRFTINNIAFTTSSFTVYFDGDQNTTNFTVPKFDFLDLYDDIPLKINKSFAEIQDIAKRNSDYSIGVKLPGSKKNNRFFEDFYNVDAQSLYFDVTNKVNCQILIDDESYFTGYLKLNKISVLNSKVEYDVTLYSNVGDLYGAIGNNLLKDLNFNDVDYHFNHVFNQMNTIAGWRYETLKSNSEVPSHYFYPVNHNGYNYETSGNTTAVQLTGVTGTSFYTATKVGQWVNNATAYSAGVQRYYINSPEDGVRDNQLKPALNVYSLIQLMFKTYGYTIKSDFMSTPWMKLLYTYGYYSSNSTKLTYQTPPAQTYGLEGVEVILIDNEVIDSQLNCETYYDYRVHNWTLYVVKKDTGIPVLCNQEIVLNWDFNFQPCYGGSFDYLQQVTIPAGTTGNTYSYTSVQYVDCGFGCPFQLETIQNNGFNATASNVGLSNKPLAYLPSPANTIVEVTDGTFLDFSLIIDQNIKQIDILSSIAKKYNLVFIPDPEVPNQIIIESYPYYVGTGNIYDWTDKLSFDKGWSVEPALNFIESELIVTDLEDGDSGNIQFKEQNNRIYGENKQYNPTQFKSSTKKIETTFSPQVIRKWNPNNNPLLEPNAVGIPMGINYAESSQEVGSGVAWLYKGVKTKPKLMFNLGNFSPFLDTAGETFNLNGATTFMFRVTEDDGTNSEQNLISPVVSHTMPMGNLDKWKITNDSISILFNSEEPVAIAGDSVSLFNAYTNQDAYNLFYEQRVSNAFDKNTRYLSGNFYLKLSDVKNLRANDLIKINDQYFTWNQIKEYNLTNRELTQVELVQTNYNPQVYPDRYFKYVYCDNTGVTYNVKTNFTGTDSVQESLYYWSILYDYFCGTLGASEVVQITGYTSSFLNSTGSTVPYSIREVTKAQYESGGTDWTLDPNKNQFIGQIVNFPLDTWYNQNNDVWLIDDIGSEGTLNVFTSCAAFTAKATAMGITIGSST
jgi:hypothetical protein